MQEPTSQDSHKQIAEKVASAPVVLFMKGTRHQPQCGFSATVVGILDSLLADYETVNVLADPAIRQGIKEYSNWPTIPQLYVNGEFLGGCDIVREMHQSGELEGAFGLTGKTIEPPSFTVTAKAVEVFRQALAEDGEDGLCIHIEINSHYQTQLGIEPASESGLCVEASGLTFVFDRLSAQRASGMVIDFVEKAGQSGFKIDNPNAPPQVKQMSVQDLKAKLDAGETFEFIDVRTPRERGTAAIEGTKLLDDELHEAMMKLDRKTPLVLHCHHGGRSNQAAEYFLSQGFVEVANVVGGIDAWSLHIDPSVPRY